MSNTMLNQAIRIDYLFADRYDFTINWVFPENVVPYSMFRYIVDGKARFLIDNDQFIVNKGQIVYIPEGSTLFCEALEKEFSFISIRFSSPISTDKLDEYPGHYNIPAVVDCNDEDITQYFFKILQVRDSGSVGKWHKIKGYLELIMAFMLEQGYIHNQLKATESSNEGLFVKLKKQKSKIVRTDSRVKEVVEYLTTHLNEKIDLNKLYEIADLSPSAFRRIFKQNTGKSVNSFILDLKMSNAARKLISTNLRISDIAYSLGYDDHNYFARQFKKNYGVSPMKYRELSR